MFKDLFAAEAKRRCVRHVRQHRIGVFNQKTNFFSVESLRRSIKLRKLSFLNCSLNEFKASSIFISDGSFNDFFLEKAEILIRLKKIIFSLPRTNELRQINQSNKSFIHFIQHRRNREGREFFSFIFNVTIRRSIISQIDFRSQIQTILFSIQFFLPSFYLSKRRKMHQFSQTDISSSLIKSQRRKLISNLSLFSGNCTNKIWLRETHKTITPAITAKTLESNRMYYVFIFDELEQYISLYKHTDCTCQRYFE